MLNKPFRERLLFATILTVISGFVGWDYLGPLASDAWRLSPYFSSLTAPLIRRFSLVGIFVVALLWTKPKRAHWSGFALALISLLPILHGAIARAGFDAFLGLPVLVLFRFRKTPLLIIGILCATGSLFLMQNFFWSWDVVNIYAALGLNRIPVENVPVALSLVILSAAAGIAVARRKSGSNAASLGLGILIFQIFCPGQLHSVAWLPLPFFYQAACEDNAYRRPLILLSIILLFDSFGCHSFYSLVYEYSSLYPNFGTGWSMPSFWGSLFIKFGIIFWVLTLKQTATNNKIPAEVQTLAQKWAALIENYREQPIIRWRLSWIFVIAIVACSLLLNFYRLGNRTIPISGVEGSSQISFEIPSNQPAAYAWINHLGGEVRVTVVCDWGTEWKNLGRVDQLGWILIKLSRPCAGPVQFKWEKLPKLRWVRTTELIFFDRDYKKIVPTSVCDPNGSCVASKSHPLFDESENITSIPHPEGGAVVDEFYNAGPGVGLLLHRPIETILNTAHPYLGRWFIYLSMRAVGIGPFGWRLPSALFSAFLPLLVFLLARTTLKSEKIGVLAAAVALGDFLRIGLGHTAFVSPQLSFFILLHIWLVAEAFAGKNQERVLCTLGMAWLSCAAAISTKWLGIFPAAITGPLTIWLLRELWRGRLKKAFIIAIGILVCALSAATYLGPYMPFLSVKNNKGISSHQNHMLEVHSAKVGIADNGESFANTQISSAGPVDWLFNNVTLRVISVPHVRPVAVYLFSNPFIAWGLVISLVSLSWRRRTYTFGQLLVGGCFVAQILPWFVIRRYSMPYHFLPALMLGCVLLTSICSQIEKKWVRHLTLYGLIGSSYVALLFFWPVLFGTPVEPGRLLGLRWFYRWFSEFTFLI